MLQQPTLHLHLPSDSGPESQHHVPFAVFQSSSSPFGAPFDGIECAVDGCGRWLTCFFFCSGELKKTPPKKEAPETIDYHVFFVGSGVGTFARSVFYSVGSHDFT